jgi:hypothetical protein
MRLPATATPMGNVEELSEIREDRDNMELDQ